MADNISLTSAVRTNLLSLQRTTDSIDKTQERLSTGKRVNSAVDDALAFFTSRSLNNRASDLGTVKDGIQEGINQIETAIKSLETIEDILKQMKAVASSAKSTAAEDTAARDKLVGQFNELRSQIDHLTLDSTYNGVNLVKSGADTLTVKFSEISDSRSLVIDGARSDASGLQLTTASSDSTAATNANIEDWAATGGYVSAINNTISKVDDALSTVRQSAQTFGTNASMLEIRQNFTEDLINTLQGGAADLVNADLNEESANMLSLQTRQQLGTIALSMANQSQQSILRLF